MSLFGGSKTTNIYTPQKAPLPPVRNDAESDKSSVGVYRRSQAGKTSYVKSFLGGSAPAPSKSYAAQLYGTGSM